LTFEEWYARDGNRKIVEKQKWWSSEDVKRMLEASWTSAYEVCEIEKDGIINFLKKELIKKTYCRQVMKKQYRELKQKYEALLHKINPVDTRFSDFVKSMK
jgi:hypothetical protein